MKTTTSTKAGILRNHNEKMARVENAAKNNAERNNRRQSRRNDGYGIKVMSIRTGIKAGWISSNHK